MLDFTSSYERWNALGNRDLKMLGRRRRLKRDVNLIVIRDFSQRWKFEFSYLMVKDPNVYIYRGRGGGGAEGAEAPHPHPHPPHFLASGKKNKSWEKLKL